MPADNTISSRDYEEPRCPFEVPDKIRPIPIGRVIEKLDEYLSAKDHEAAARHLRYWYAEAEASRDMKGKLTVLNEQIGLYRKTEKEAEGMAAIKEALALAESRDFAGTLTAGTTFLNAATGLKAFDRAKEALTLYRRAAEIYERMLSPDDPDLAGLYNNTAVTLAELEEYAEAEAMYFKALGILENIPGKEAERAVTYCNLADLYTAADTEEEAERKAADCLAKAETLLDTESLPEDGTTAFFLEKCAPVFGFYGWFFAEQKFMKRAEAIYERT